MSSLDRHHLQFLHHIRIGLVQPLRQNSSSNKCQFLALCHRAVHMAIVTGGKVNLSGVYHLRQSYNISKMGNLELESYGGKLRGKLRVTFQESYGKVTGKLQESYRKVTVESYGKVTINLRIWSAQGIYANLDHCIFPVTFHLS